MEENNYRDTYRSINPLRCVFEKSINTRRCHCSLSERFNLADREGVRCTVDLAQKRCTTLLETLRSKAIFTMQLTRIDGALPHNKEIKVQTGGLLGLQNLIDPAYDETLGIQDIHQLINQAIEIYKSTDEFPYNEIVRKVAKFEGRNKRVKTGK
ncbi:MAG: hypothetical protein OEY52_00390 [Gammaproteobacteria bacterium]|nr:hypothetical protein [Gammaproteobacteria bacterium]